MQILKNVGWSVKKDFNKIDTPINCPHHKMHTELSVNVELLIVFLNTSHQNYHLSNNNYKKKQHVKINTFYENLLLKKEDRLDTSDLGFKIPSPY